MVKYISKIINKIIGTFFSAFHIFIFIAVTILVFRSTYLNLSIINAPLKKGMITDVEVETGSGRETHAYRAFGYTIQIENKKYYSSNNPFSRKHEIGDVVRGYIRGKKGFILTEVNGIKVRNKYNIPDYICFILSLLIVFIIIYKIKKYYEKN